MEKAEIQSKVFEIIAGICEVSVDQVNGNSTVGDFPAWDSLGQLNILQSVQDEFEVEFEPEEMMDIEDANDIVNLVEGKL